MSTQYNKPSEVPTDTLIMRIETLVDAVIKGDKDEFKMRIPAECDRDADIVLTEVARRLNKLKEQLAKANERVKELEQVNLELATNVEACCELTEMDMGAAIERLFEIDNTESKELLNKFAIEKKIEGIQKVLDCRELNLSQGDIDTIKLIQEQLRKEQKQ